MDSPATPERRQRIQELFLEAVGRPPSARAAFLDLKCRNDPQLRAEVEELLRTSAGEEITPQNPDLIASPPTAGSRSSHSIPAGTRIAHYDIVGELGGGGMGVVYEARDSRLGRSVALKFLPPLISHDADVRARFEQEARAASVLDHPNICTIHEIGEGQQGQLYISMALYRGETLKERLESGRLPTEQAVEIATQIGRGLDRAHQAGIVHRDVKPANVMLTEDGQVKILDFGLAKLDEVQLTRSGLTLGTVAYMSPEQARGERVDARTDVWSLGVVLYEMLTGRPPFQGEYSQAVIYSLLNTDPEPIEKVNPEVSGRLAKVVGRCLQKDADKRYASVSEVLADLAPVPAGGTVPVVHPPQRSRRTVIASASLVTVLLALLAIAPVRRTILDAMGISGLPEEKHLVVLSQAGPAESPEQAAFRNGLAETLVESLRRIEGAEKSLWVVPTDKVVEFGVESPAAARRAFGANLAVSLEVNRDANDVRVSLHLVDTESAKTLRTSELDRTGANLSDLKGDLVLALADLLDVSLRPSDHRALAMGGTAAPGAYEFYTQGLGYLRQHTEGRNVDAAIFLFEQALRHDSLFALAHAGLGEAYLRKFTDTKDLQWAQAAERHCETAIEIDDQLAPVYVTLGKVHIGAGRYGTALAEFQLALARDSSYADAYRGMAKAYESLGRIDDAESAIRRAIAMKPDYWEGYNDLGVLYFNQGRYEDAIRQFENVIKLTPLNFKGYRNLGAMYFYLDRRQDAVEMFENAIDIQPDYSTYANLATLYFYEGRYADVARMYERALEIQDTDYRIWGYLASAYEESGQPDAARRANERAADMAKDHLERNRRDPEVMAQLAGYYVELQRRDEARSMLKDLIAQRPGDPEELSRIADIYERLGERDEALRWLERALVAGYSLVDIDDNPELEELRQDPRFASLRDRYQGDVPEQIP